MNIIIINHKGYINIELIPKPIFILIVRNIGLLQDLARLVTYSMGTKKPNLEFWDRLIQNIIFMVKNE